MVARLPPIAGLDETSSGWGFFLCARKERRSGRDGGAMVVTLQDATGQIAGRLGGDAEAAAGGWAAGDFVRVEGRAIRTPHRLELAIDAVRRVDPAVDASEGFREDACVLSAPRPIDEMWRELDARVAAVADPWLRRLLTEVLARHGDRLRIWPAALVVHHAYRGGLLEHVLTIADAGSALAGVYGADRDLLLAGAVLHDLGKLGELAYDGATTYSLDGNLLGHIAIGLTMVREIATGIDGFPADLRTRLEHLILSHHGSRELGSPVEPMSIEAFILSALDELDATLHQVARHIRDDGGAGPLTAYHPRLGRVLLKPSAR
jgi:3'-5' exoribonuclease